MTDWNERPDEGEERPSREAVAAFLAQLHTHVSEVRRREASGWLVVVVDPELLEPVSSAYGPVDTPEDALVLAGQMDAEWAKHDQPPVRHVIIPLFDIGVRKKERVVRKNHIKLIDIDRGLVWIDGERLDPAPSIELFNHSPDGFSWGYAGSGPAQLALAILLHVTQDPDVSVRLHQHFKMKYVASWPEAEYEDWIDVEAWVAATLDAQGARQ